MKGDLLMERISLGALIIALCMLTDNAIIVIEGIKVGIEAGEDKLQVIRDVSRRTSGRCSERRPSGSSPSPRSDCRKIEPASIAIRCFG